MKTRCCDTCEHFRLKVKPVNTGYGQCRAPTPDWLKDYFSAIGEANAREVKSTDGSECRVWAAAPP
jgi:hypothetical protein